MPPQDWGVMTSRGELAYLHLLDPEVAEEIEVPAMGDARIRTARVLGTERSLEFSSDGPLRLEIPKDARDPIDTIVVLEMDR